MNLMLRFEMSNKTFSAGTSDGIQGVRTGSCEPVLGMS